MIENFFLFLFNSHQFLKKKRSSNVSFFVLSTALLTGAQELWSIQTTVAIKMTARSLTKSRERNVMFVRWCVGFSHSSDEITAVRIHSIERKKNCSVIHDLCSNDVYVLHSNSKSICDTQQHQQLKWDLDTLCARHLYTQFSPKCEVRKINLMLWLIWFTHHCILLYNKRKDRQKFNVQSDHDRLFGRFSLLCLNISSECRDEASVFISKCLIVICKSRSTQHATRRCKKKNKKQTERNSMRNSTEKRTRNRNSYWHRTSILLFIVIQNIPTTWIVMNKINSKMQFGLLSLVSWILFFMTLLLFIHAQFSFDSPTSNNPLSIVLIWLYDSQNSYALYTIQIVRNLSSAILLLIRNYIEHLWAVCSLCRSILIKKKLQKWNVSKLIWSNFDQNIWSRETNISVNSMI